MVLFCGGYRPVYEFRLWSGAERLKREPCFTARCRGWTTINFISWREFLLMRFLFVRCLSIPKSTRSFSGGRGY